METVKYRLETIGKHGEIKATRLSDGAVCYPRNDNIDMAFEYHDKFVPGELVNRYNEPEIYE